jgi:oxygen-independent coproporphyrinogen-3 oxidase
MLKDHMPPLYDISADTRSLYVHWPFCPYKCHFCPFVAITSHDQYMTQYHTALMRELVNFADCGGFKESLQTLYFGGGTPSTYPDHLLLDTFGILESRVTIDPQAEITIEVNPGTVREEQLPLWKELGINRLSIGVQSIKDDVLKALNRHQKLEDVTRLLDSASRFFDNLSVDIILGLPGVSAQDWRQLIMTLKNWPISHVSLYFLTVHEETPLFFKVQAQKVVLPDDDSLIDLYYWSRDKLLEFGFEHYEISSFARPGKFSRHNSVYWQRRPFKGIGLGAFSFDGNKRFSNEKNLMKYMNMLEQGEDVTVFKEELTPAAIRLERLMLKLRSMQGVDDTMLFDGLTSEQCASIKEQIDILTMQGSIEIQDGMVLITPMGLTIENEIAVRLSP